VHPLKTSGLSVLLRQIGSFARLDFLVHHIKKFIRGTPQVVPICKLQSEYLTWKEKNIALTISSFAGKQLFLRACQGLSIISTHFDVGSYSRFTVLAL